MARPASTSPAVRPGIVALGVGIPLAALALAVAVLVGGDGDDPAAPASTTTATTTATSTAGPEARIDESWNRALEAAVRPLDGVLVELASTVDRHSTGAATAQELAATLERVRPVVMDVRDDVAELPAHPDDPLATSLVATTAQLYVHAVEAHTASLTAGAADVGDELDKLGRRLRILADRVFDRARERTSAPVELGDDVRLVRPAEVPDWERLELAAGPPLEPTDPNRPGDLPRERQERRRSQPVGDWSAAVEELDAPTAAAVRSAPVEELPGLARRLIAAAEALRDVAVPDGDRGRADRVALGWLLRADAARAAQLSELGPDVPGLDALAASLLELSSIPALSSASGS